MISSCRRTHGQMSQISSDRTGTRRTDHTVAPKCGRRPHAECGDRESPRFRDTAHLCRIQFQHKEIRLRRFCRFELQVPGSPQAKLILEGHHQTGARPMSTSQTELLNWMQKSRGTEKPKHCNSESGHTAALSGCEDVFPAATLREVR